MWQAPDGVPIVLTDVPAGHRCEVWFGPVPDELERGAGERAGIASALLRWMFRISEETWDQVTAQALAKTPRFDERPR